MPLQPSQITEPVPLISTGRYLPTAQDILIVRSYFLLLKKPLCYELVDIILDEACYWAHSTVEVEYPASADPSIGQDRMYLRTLPLAMPGTEGDFVFSPQDVKDIRLGPGPGRSNLSVHSRLHPCRLIVFELWSHDQGWSTNNPNDHGTYKGSYTWWDASPSSLVFADAEAIPDGSPVRFHQHEQLRPPVPNERSLQRNLHAVKETQHHIVEWSYADTAASTVDQQDLYNCGRGPLSADGNFVRNLKVGDCIALWASARFREWEMHVERAKISVYWAI
ncbi:hypothetical protein EDD16DRAFT_1825728 [Pisolithus croceorrhizus]|nr:hypothetical protein EDD16DRAFT_1825728 [Pisolithus croceorrhizus]KAI6167693.1 hypothetical protein EDD17DRAFT_1685797 [Pisolithus thermaeus]